MKKPARNNLAQKAAPAKPPAAVPHLGLRDTQALFQEAILNGDQRILAALCDNSKTTRDTLFGVYQNAYVGRLVEILANDYEAVARYCGDELFHRLACAYVAAHPSQSPNARWYGSRFPAFVRAHPDSAAYPGMPDLAELEMALSNAFDAADAEPLSLSDLAVYAPDDWGRLTFSHHPSAALHEFGTDVFSLWQALQDDAEPPPAPAVQCHHLIVWRMDAMPMVRTMGREEAMMWIEAGRGLRFEALCEMLAVYDDPGNAAARAAGYLQGWLTSGLLASAQLTA